MRELVKGLGLTPSSATKTVQSWSALNQFKGPGPKYMAAEPDPYDLSSRIVKLTPKGQRAIGAILGTDE